MNEAETKPRNYRKEATVIEPVKAHTPGPWHWDSDPVKGDPTGRVRYRVCALGKTIMQVYNSSFEGGPTNAEADARLIAAAPDLLQSLEDIIRSDASTRTMRLEQAKTLVRKLRECS